MSRPPIELRHYHNQQLMDELNELCISLKIWLYPDQFGDKLQGFQQRYPRPSMREIDMLQARINTELRKDSEPMRKY